MYPLNKSKAKVVIARNLFPVLRTFVVPILPEPTVLISFFRNTLVYSKPNGIDPKRYE